MLVNNPTTCRFGDSKPLVKDMERFESKLERTINEIFGEEPFNAVDEQLFKWLMFSMIGNGRHIRNLDSLNYTLFKEKLNILLDAVYEWQVDELQRIDR
jgi:hypothetical protein